MILWGRLPVFFILVGFLIQLSAFAEPSKTTYIKGIYSLPLTLDPIQMNDAASLSVGNLIYDGLLKFSPTLKVESALAESWSTSNDGKTLTFKLKKKIFFHDGTPILAGDAVFSLKRAMSKDSKVRKYFDCLKEIIAIDSHTLELKLTHPFPPILSVLAGATAKILPAIQANQPSFFKNPVGSGPFKFISVSESKTELQLESFGDYHSGKPSIDHLVLKVTDEATAIKLAQAGLIHDLSNWPLTESNPVFKTGTKVSTPVAATWIIGLNTLTAPFNETKTRQLFKSQVPSEKFRTTFFPDAQSATGYIPNGLPGSQVKSNLNPTGKASVQKITLAIPVELAQSQEIKKFFESSMKEQGWNLEVILLPWEKLMKGYSKKKLQAFLVSMNMDYPDAEFLLKNFESDNSDNFSSLKNARVDELLKLSRTSQDRKARESYYSEALKLIEQAAVTVNLFHPRANYWVSNCVKGFNTNILSDVYIDYSKVAIEPNCTKASVVQR